jgi:hypothetical protein
MAAVLRMVSAVKLNEASGAIAAVGESPAVQGIQDVPVELPALTLDKRRFVPDKTKSFQIPQDEIRVFLTGAGFVNVFNAEKPCSALAPRPQKTAQGRCQRTEVQRAAGRGGKSSAIHESDGIKS